MNVNELHKITGDLIAAGHGNDDVAVDVNAFFEGDNGENISPVENGNLETVKLGGVMDEEEREVTESYLVFRGI